MYINVCNGFVHTRIRKIRCLRRRGRRCSDDQPHMHSRCSSAAVRQFKNENRVNLMMMFGRISNVPNRRLNSFRYFCFCFDSNEWKTNDKFHRKTKCIFWNKRRWILKTKPPSHFYSHNNFAKSCWFVFFFLPSFLYLSLLLSGDECNTANVCVLLPIWNPNIATVIASLKCERKIRFSLSFSLSARFSERQTSHASAKTVKRGGREVLRVSSGWWNRRMLQLYSGIDRVWLCHTRWAV